MLGKTNITTLSEGGIATEIEDLRWIQVQSGVSSDFVKAIFQNGYLAAITTDGAIVYSTDGEVWEVVQVEATDCKLNDIDWDGEKFLLVGSSTEESGTSEKTGLVIATTDFKTLEKIDALPYNEYFMISPRNGKYILVARKYSTVYVLSTDLTEGGTQETQLDKYGENLQGIMVAKSTEGALVCIQSYRYGTGAYAGMMLNHIDMVKVNGNGIIELYPNLKATNKNMLSVFTSKDTLYFMCLQNVDNYRLNRVTGSDEIMTVCTGQDFALRGGVYFNNCQLFINNHEMLIVKKGENFADKTLDDLIEIAPELTMNCITKAFGQLYIFGNQGAILKSSVETNNENAITVQTLSAKKALADAKLYTDTQFAVLEARIAALEGATTE